MSLSTYTLLKTQIAEHLDRDNDSSIDTFIDLAEARHKREVRIRDMITRSNLTVNARYVALPTGFLEMKSLRLLTDPLTVLNEVAQHEMNRYRQETTGKPKYFTVSSDIEFDKAADQSYTGEILFYKEVDPLSDSNPTNTILTRAPDLYLYGALLASSPYLMNDERLRVWGELYTSALTGINEMDRRRAGPLVARVQGPTP